jgi:DNA modification methylase
MKSLVEVCKSLMGKFTSIHRPEDLLNDVKGPVLLHISDTPSEIYPFIFKIIDVLKPKDLVGIPWRVAFALQSDGWYLRQDIIWAKPNPMPESVKDRCTKSHEYIFLLTKSAQYYYDNEAIRETAKNANKTISLGEKSFSKRQAKGVGVEPSGNGKSDNYTVKEYRNKRSVWTVATKPFKGAHFAVFPPALIEPCILAGCRVGGTVLDPFMGSGTTGLVAKEQNKNYIGFEMNSDYCDIANKRISEEMAQIELYLFS